MWFFGRVGASATVPVSTPTHTDRIVTIAAEVRVLSTVAESRIITIAAE